jgi:hypothetical protein
VAEENPEIDSSQPKRRRKKPKQKGRTAVTKRTRTPRPYPASSFSDALPLAEAIHKIASGEKVRRLTLLKQMNRSPTSSGTKMLITNSGKYGLTTGSYAAEWLELTQVGKVASASESASREKRQAQFDLAIKGVAPFALLYEKCVGKKLPSHDVLKDMLSEAEIEVEDPAECIDTFVVNTKDLGLLQTIAGAETLVSIESVLDDLGAIRLNRVAIPAGVGSSGADHLTASSRDWSKVCFMVTPIGDDESEWRKHSDLFLSSLVEPAMKEFGLQVVRADRIGEAGMITAQILEHVMRAKLVIVDMSFHNPNVFYEMALRHACQLPVIQIIRKCDRLPFDVNQVRTVVVDTTDIYTLIPKLETYRSEIATQVRAALADGQTTSNPISVFFPGFKVTIP